MALDPELFITEVADTTDVHALDGNRGVKFTFTLKDGSKRQAFMAPEDGYRQYGKSWAMYCQQALTGMIAAGLGDEINTEVPFAWFAVR